MVEFFAADARGSLPKSANGDAGAAAAGPARPADALGRALAERSPPVADPVVFRQPALKEIESESVPRFPFFRCAPCTSDPCTTSCSSGPILAETAAAADVAATLIANAVNADHPAVERVAASEMDDQTDLGDRLVTVNVGDLDAGTVEAALAEGMTASQRMRDAGLISAAVLVLKNEIRAIGDVPAALPETAN